MGILEALIGIKIVILTGIAILIFKHLKLRRERRKKMAVFQYEMKQFKKKLKGPRPKTTNNKDKDDA